jgi:DNA-binding NarL/FixJ family response regulator
MKTAMPAQQRSAAQILLVDDHPMTLDGIAQLIALEPDLAVCVKAGNAAQALTAIEKNKLDLVVTDFTLPDKSGIELIKDIKAIQPALPVLVVSMHDEAIYAERALRAGAAGYLMKVEGGAKLIAGIRRVLAGEISLSEKIAGRILRGFSGHTGAKSSSPVEELSDREFEVFILLGQGLATRDIGDRLHLSAKTVEAHRANVKAKLGIETVSELIAYSARWSATEGSPG